MIEKTRFSPSVSPLGLAFGLAAVLFVAVNVLAQGLLRDARLDLTHDRLYTLSPGTKTVLAGLREPVTLRLYFSERLSEQVPQLRTYAQRVRELLEEYAGRSAGKVTLQVIDPEPYSDAEDRAVQAGLQGVPLDRTSGRQFYFGLVGTNSTDRKEIISFFQQEREAFLEYDLTKLVYALGEAKKPVVGILTDMPLEYGPGGVMAAMRGGGQPYAILSQLKTFFDVRMLKSDSREVPGDISVLVVARPRNLPDPALYAVDQYVLRGGHTIVFADPFVESEAEGQPGQPAPADPAAVPTKLFDGWGLSLAVDKFVADPQLALDVQAGDAGRRRTVPYAAWLGLGPENRDRGDATTADLGTINMASAGEIATKPGSGVTLQPLLTSSDQGRLMDTTRLRARPDPEAMLNGLQKQPAESRVLAARVFGTLTSAFAAGPPAPEVKAGEVVPEPVNLSTPHLTKSAEPPRLVVVADSDMLEDRFWVEDQSLLGQRFASPFAANGDLFLNLVENMAGSADLIGLRGRAGSSRPFVLVDNLRRAAGEQMLERQDMLQKQLEQADRQIAELQSKAKTGSGAALLSAEEQKTIDQFREQALQARKELREVQHALNKDIERLATVVKAINIVAVPLAVVVAALVVTGLRARRRRALTKSVAA